VFWSDSARDSNPGLTTMRQTQTTRSCTGKQDHTYNFLFYFEHSTSSLFQHKALNKFGSTFGIDFRPSFFKAVLRWCFGKKTVWLFAMQALLPLIPKHFWTKWLKI